VKQLLRFKAKTTKATDSYREVLQTKRGSIPLGMSLLVCGPAWA